MEPPSQGDNGGEEKTILALNSTPTDPALKVMCDEYGKYLDFPELTKSHVCDSPYSFSSLLFSSLLL